MTPACEPVKDCASAPSEWMAIATSAFEMRSPEVSSMSISRAGGAGHTWFARSSSSSVVSPIAETTTTTSLPARLVSTIRSATRRMRSAEETELPPYFWTTSATWNLSVAVFDVHVDPTDLGSWPGRAPFQAPRNPPFSGVTDNRWEREDQEIPMNPYGGRNTGPNPGGPPAGQPGGKPGPWQGGYPQSGYPQGPQHGGGPQYLSLIHI